MPRLESWSMVGLINPYWPPEMRIMQLQGIVYDHPRLEDGEHIITSALVKIDIKKGTAQTFSGSIYSLGKPDFKWLVWLEKKGFTEHLEDLKKLTSRFIN